MCPCLLAAGRIPWARILQGINAALLAVIAGGLTPGIRSSWLSFAPYVAVLTWFTLGLSVWTFLVSFRSGCTRYLPGKWLDGLPWTVLAFGIACGVLWFWGGTGRGVDICNILTSGWSACAGSVMPYVMAVILGLSLVLQGLNVLFTWRALKKHAGGGGGDYDQVSSLGRAKRRGGMSDRERYTGAADSDSEGEDEERMELGRSGRGRRGGSGSEWSYSSGEGRSGSEDEGVAAGMGVQTRSDEPQHLPHLDAGTQHRARVVPTGNVDVRSVYPLAFETDEGSPFAGDSGSGGLKRDMDDGVGHQQGDSEHHTSMHVPHGSHEQEMEEERLKEIMAKGD
ncbi:hypothetical protein Rhopal_004188-T1 [Rhodotorula paludigena]|uniref:MARVEL domain-containing protein n=1 Tax=Rhodotorula paludigena TaxID=86838 RepID=A0AAV5GNS4_9BASI|nr:hypothetical protein Rhopal_004188-T1 [Rhodotorula paludigena]